jgi:mannose-6-phosphate isomerase
MERVWGGRELQRIYGRALPDPHQLFGESWELVDRHDAQSIVDHGPLAGSSLHDLWTTRCEELFGAGYSQHPRFPILAKVLDAREDLSLQVHPPEKIAASLGDEAKTEMWFIADCEPGAKLYVGLKRSVTRDAFKHALDHGSVAACVHVLTPKPGDSIFIPAGRLHAIGAGFLIHEIQQNSDSTYRVFDWNRLGLDGQPRTLHIAQSLASIAFDDFEPSMDQPAGDTLASCAYFRTDRKFLSAGQVIANRDAATFSILSVVEGALISPAGRHFRKGQWLILPRQAAALSALENSTVLQVTVPQQS